MPNPVNHLPEFSCPLCGGHRVEKVVVKRADNREYETQFWQCRLCSVMMMNPRKFLDHVKVRMPAKEPQ